MLLALVSTMDSITSLPLPLRTAITIASLCTSMPIYLMSRLIPLPPWGIDHSRQRSLSLKVKCHSSADLPIFSSGSCPHPLFSPLNGPLSHNALTGICEMSPSSFFIFQQHQKILYIGHLLPICGCKRLLQKQLCTSCRGLPFDVRVTSLSR